MFGLRQTFIYLGWSEQNVFSSQNITWSQKLLGSSAKRSAYSIRCSILPSVSSGFVAGVWLCSPAGCNLFLIVCVEHLSPCSSRMLAAVVNGALSPAAAMAWTRVRKQKKLIKGSGESHVGIRDISTHCFLVYTYMSLSGLPLVLCSEAGRSDDGSWCSHYLDGA